MNLRTPLVLATVAGPLVAGSALPASADDAVTTFQLTAGTLTLSVQPTAALTNAAAGTTAIFGSLGVVAVTDNRGGIANWNVSGASAGFTGAGGSTSTAVSYTGGVVTTSGTIVVAPGTEKSMSATPRIDVTTLPE